MDKAQFDGLRQLARTKMDEPGQARILQPRFRWKSRVVVPALIIAGFVGLQGATLYRQLSPAAQVHAVPVLLKRAEGAVAGTVTVQAAGWLEAEPYKSYVTALTDGVVNEVLVLEGDPVKAGQVVVRLVDEDARLAVQSAESKVKELSALLDVARAELVAAQSAWENPVERKRAIEVSEARLAESRATLDKVAADIEEEVANLERVKSDYDRGKALHASKSISESELIRRHSEFEAQKAKIVAQRKQLAATKGLIAKHEADLTAATEHMRLRTEERLELNRARATVAQREASLQQARTALEGARLRLQRMEIRSPSDGIVMQRLTEPGSKVVMASDNPGSARVLSLYQPERLQVRVDVPLADAGKVGVGQQAEIAVEVLPDRSFAGTVTRVLHEANIQKNTLEVKVSIADPDPRLRPEMLGKVRILEKADSQESETALRLFVPAAALSSIGGTPTVWVVDDFEGDRGLARSKSVKVGSQRIEGLAHVVEGLQPGDLVITKSPAELADGQRVQVVVE